MRAQGSEILAELPDDLQPTGLVEIVARNHDEIRSIAAKGVFHTITTGHDDRLDTAPLDGLKRKSE